VVRPENVQQLRSHLCTEPLWQSQVYDKAVRTVPEDAKLAIYDRYLKRASTFFGIAKARSSGKRCFLNSVTRATCPLKLVRQPLRYAGMYAYSAASFASLAAQVREIYEMAVEAEPPYSLSDADCKTMCLRYARVEKQVSVVFLRHSAWSLSKRGC